MRVPRGAVCLRPAIRGGRWWPRHSGAAGVLGKGELAAEVTFSQGRDVGRDGNEDGVVVLGPRRTAGRHGDGSCGAGGVWCLGGGVMLTLGG